MFTNKIVFFKSSADVVFKQKQLNLLKRSFSMKIYTKTGDKGTTATFTGHRRPKSDIIFDTLGTSDELSSCIGHARSFLHNRPPLTQLDEELRSIQCDLQDLQAAIATPKSLASEGQLAKTEFPTHRVNDLEKMIDTYSESLPPLKNFILPSGSPAGSALHVARGVCRRAERSAVRLLESGDIDDTVYIYLNRLSDYLFTAARKANQMEDREEDIYK